MQTDLNLRYERKYVVDTPFFSNIESYLLVHPAGFFNNYPQRQVNSLYFDSPTLKNYQASLDGDYNRLKPRIRWYGTNTKKITNGQLELKIKQGELGYKKISKINKTNLSLKGPFPKKLENLIPIHLTSYTRQYFLSANKKVRLTIDQGISYTNFLHLTKNSQADPRTIVEIKYGQKAESYALTVPQSLPLTLNRVSKYVSGIDCLLNPLDSTFS